MRHSRNHLCVTVVGLFFVLGLFSSIVLAQEAVPVMTLADGTKVTMTQAQFDSLVTQAGIAYYGPTGARPQATATQVVVPLPPASGGLLGGGFIVGEPAAIAAGMNAVGITSAATGAGLTGGTAVAGAISTGAAAAGTAATAGSEGKQ
jgi:Zn-dependent alcohol dehydrogenase